MSYIRETCSAEITRTPNVRLCLLWLAMDNSDQDKSYEAAFQMAACAWGWGPAWGRLALGLCPSFSIKSFFLQKTLQSLKLFSKVLSVPCIWTWATADVSNEGSGLKLVAQRTMLPEAHWNPWELGEFWTLSPAELVFPVPVLVS